jgi:hypothetical protein
VIRYRIKAFMTAIAALRTRDSYLNRDVTCTYTRTTIALLDSIERLNDGHDFAGKIIEKQTLLHK